MKITIVVVIAIVFGRHFLFVDVLLSFEVVTVVKFSSVSVIEVIVVIAVEVIEVVVTIDIAVVIQK